MHAWAHPIISPCASITTAMLGIIGLSRYFHRQWSWFDVSMFSPGHGRLSSSSFTIWFSSSGWASLTVISDNVGYLYDY